MSAASEGTMMDLGGRKVWMCDTPGCEEIIDQDHYNDILDHGNMHREERAAEASRLADELFGGENVSRETFDLSMAEALIVDAKRKNAADLAKAIGAMENAKAELMRHTAAVGIFQIAENGFAAALEKLRS